MRYRTRLAVLLATLPILGTACGGSAQPNILLVTLDTTRADHLGCYGYPQPTSPAIDAIAADGFVFENAFTTNPITLPAHTSIMTGTYPMSHGVRDNTSFVVPEQVETLAERLSAARYDTAAFVGAFVLDSSFNLDQGFGTYDDDIEGAWSRDELEARRLNAFGFAERKANTVTAAALEWLSGQRRKPFFLWLHYFDPHQPINPPEPHHSRFPVPYDGEIAFTDEQLGKVLDWLRRHEQFDDTIIVIVGDHGEGLLDHGEPSHSLLIYDSTTRVPLVIRVPWLPGGRRIGALTSIVDVAPTLLELAGVEPPEDVQGISLTGLLDGAPEDPSRRVYTESLVGRLHWGWGELRALRTPDWKLIHAPKPRLYQVGEDPEEIYDLADDETARVDEMSNDLGRLLRRWSADGPGLAAARTADEETLNKLAALGYLSSSAPATRGITDVLEPPGQRQDPHNKNHLYDLYSVAREYLRMGQVELGMRELYGIIGQDPDNVAALTSLASAYYTKLNDHPRAEELYRRSLEIEPSQEEAHYYLARIVSQRGDDDAARAHCEAILAFQPRSLGALNELGLIYARTEEFDRAREHFEMALEIDPEALVTLINLADFHVKRGENEAAATIFNRARGLDPRNPELLHKYASWKIDLGKIDEAEAALRHAVAANPNFHLNNHLLGKLLIEQGKPEAAREPLLRALRSSPNTADRLEIEALLERATSVPPAE